MTVEDDLLSQEERLRGAEMDWHEGMKLIEDTLKLIDEWETDLEKRRATIPKKDYASFKAEAQRRRQQNYATKAGYEIARDQIELTRQEIKRAWMKREELRYK